MKSIDTEISRRNFLKGVLTIAAASTIPACAQYPENMIHGTKIKPPKFKKTKEEFFRVNEKNYAILNGESKDATDFYLVKENDLGTQLARDKGKQISIARKIEDEEKAQEQKYEPQQPELRAEAIYLNPNKNKKVIERLSSGGDIRTLIRKNKIPGIREITIKGRKYLAVGKADYQVKKAPTHADIRFYEDGGNDNLKIQYIRSRREIIIEGQRIEFGLVPPKYFIKK